MNKEPSIRAASIYGNHTIRIQFGDLCCALICHDADVFGRLKELYDIFRSDEPADLSIELEVVDRLSFNEVMAALCQMRFGTKENRFIEMEPTLDGEFDNTNCTFSITVEKHLFDPVLGFRLMNQLLCRAYNTASQRRHNGSPVALLVHSCGILRNGQVMLFAGPCETGKTTIARLCDEEHGQVLNDEIVLIYRPHQASSACKVQGVPIIGGVPRRLNAVAPLRCVLLLKQSNRTAVRRLDRLEAYLRLMHQVISPFHWGQIDYRALVSLIDEFCDEVTRTTPFYELEFTLDKELLWKVVRELEETLGK